MAQEWIAALATLLLLAGGPEAVRPNSERLVLGKTTYSEAVAKLGAPRDEGELVKNGETVRTATYIYKPVRGKPARPDAVPARAQALYFHHGVLVGRELVSSWAADRTDFDESRIGRIVKGKTTRGDVFELLGRPAGFGVYPMITSHKGDAAIYLFSYATQSEHTALKFFRKLLIVTFDESGVVTDVEYSSSSG